jgi:cupin 2 domain-containing protein
MPASYAQNFFDLPPAGAQEHLQTLLAGEGVRIERIVSDGQTTEGWFDQLEDEWVLLVQGEALLEFDAGESRALKAGDCVWIPAHRRHRVAFTAPRTVWLAMHLRAGLVG